ncbi:hypothetical protein PV08_03329 [Exophiala spinifera]|uniref:RanBD1 domain-containing protein n=1 Tax=Exophiala spinifera TaxID=91928 RepID=A0A0D2C686_9EURO|nr:uncharacterized protein PV08_03329 [Exophiala spinifera]KIW19039.1 hypothetical protein PV08_03329 [Exophiala spinifera]
MGSTNTFGQSTQQQAFPTMNGSTSFGTSMSFPQPGSSTNSGFNFQPPQSSSFTFGAPAGTPNPFASLNGTAGPGNSQQGDIAMESPQKKTANGNAFASNSGFSFGQTTQPPSSSGFSFGGTQSTQSAANGTNPFNPVSKPDDPAAPANPFGQPSQPAFGGFGQSAQTQPSGFAFGQSTSTPAPASTTTAPSFSFGQSTTTEAPAAATPNFSFTQATATPQSALPSFSFGQASTTQAEGPKEAPKFSFGQTPATSGSQSNGPSFGFASPAATPASQPISTFSFGQTQQSTTSSPSFTGFGAKSGETKPVSSMFGPSTATPQPATTEQSNQSPQKPATPETEKTATNPFASLFAGSSSASPAPVSKPAFSFGTASTPEPRNATDPSSTQTKPAFSFGAFNQTSTSATGTLEPKPTNTGSTTFSFGAKSAPTEPTPEARGPQAAISSDIGEKSKGQEESTTPAKPSFGFAHSASPAPGGPFAFVKSDDKPKAMSNTAPAKDLAVGTTFGGTPAPGSSSKNGTAFERSGSMQKPMFGTSAQQTPRAEGKSSPAPTFSASSANKPAEDASDRSIISKASMNTTAQGAVASPPDTVSVREPTKRPVYTKGSSFFPGHLDAKQFQEYDRDYRLHSLNREFQKRIAALDPTVHDFGNIIRHYVSARDGIGASLGLYKRNFAGTKRKGEDVDDHDDEPPANKRTRPGENQQAQPAQNASASKSSGGRSTPQPSSFKAASTTLFPSTGAESSSKAASLLNNMIPQSAPAKSAQSVTAFDPSASLGSGRETTSSATGGPFASLKSQSTGPTSEPTTSTSTTPTKSPPKKPTFELPKFGGGTTNFMSAFGQQAKINAEKFEKSLMEKRKAEDFDSDEDDEEQFQKQLDEEAKAKRAKIDAIAKAGFTPSFTPNIESAVSTPAKEPEAAKFAFGGFKPSALNPFSPLNSKETSEEHSQDEDASGSSASNGGDDDEDSQEVEGSEAQNGDEDEDEDEADDDDDNDFQSAVAKSRNNANAGKSLFDRIEPNPNKQEPAVAVGQNTNASADEGPSAQTANKSTFSSSGFGFQAVNPTTETPSFTPTTPATGTYKPSTTFNFTPTPPTSSSTPTPGASIFAGGLTKDGPVPGEGLFGSRPSTPSNGEKSSNLAKSVLTSPAGTDNTWKQGGAISFANGEKKADAPSFKFTAPSPGKETPKPFGSIFGTPALGAKPSDTPTVGFQFGAPTSTPAPGFLGAVTHLGGGSAGSSAMSSRATSPGLTDNESNATNDTEETNDEPQVTLMDSRAGEENETCLWEGRSKALMFVNKEIAQGTKLNPNDWNSMGVGIIRVLKDKTTGKTRVVFRVEPSASVLVNSHLLDSVTYENVPSNKSGAVRGALFYKGTLARWVFKVKTPEMASQLSAVLEENKKSD